MCPDHGARKRNGGRCSGINLPVRRVPDCEREAWEKLQAHLHRFKGPQWRKIAIADRLRKAKAAADGTRGTLLSLSSSLSNEERPGAVSRARGVRAPVPKGKHRKKHEPLTKQAPRTKRAPKYKYRTNNIPGSAPRSPTNPAPPSEPTKKLTTANLRIFKIAMKHKHGEVGEMDFEKTAVQQLYAMIAKDPTMKAIKMQVRTIEGLREIFPPQTTDPILEHSEKMLFRIIIQGGDAEEIRMQAEAVQRLKAALTPPVPAATARDNRERSKPSKPDHGNRQENAPLQKTALAASKPDKRPPRSRASTSSLGDPFDSPQRPRRATQPRPAPKSPPRAKRTRQPTPPSPEGGYLSEDSVGPPSPKPAPIPRIRYPALKSITDKEDKASRTLMHPAAAPLAKFPEAVRQISDMEKVKAVQNVHPTYTKAITNPNNKHVRYVNRTNGPRVKVEEPARGIWARLGRMEGGERIRPPEVGGQVDHHAGLTQGGLRVPGEEREMTVAELIEKGFGSDREEEDEL